MANHNKILQLYNSRKNILEMLEAYCDYDIKEYEGFSINEVDSMHGTSQLDMLISKKDKDVDIVKTYIKYFLKGNLTDSSLRPIIEDLYQLSDTLTSNDCLLIVYDGEPTESLQTHLDHLFKKDKIFVVVINLKRLQFNILKHHLVPMMEIMSKDEKEEFYKQYNVTHDGQLPEISRYDPQALAMCVRPGQLCKFYRKSPTSMTTNYYRLCV